jgi:putative ABC transport system substrate-binding protein
MRTLATGKGKIQAPIILIFALGVLLMPLAAEPQPGGQQPKGGHTIGLLAPSGTSPHLWDAFRDGLGERGYTEGRNLTIHFRSAEGQPERLPSLAAELVSLKVDVIVTAGQPAIRAAMQATRTIPIVMAVSGDAVATGLVANLARPGGNLTGMSILAPDLSGKRLQILKEIVPPLSRVAMLWNPANQDSQINARATQSAAKELGLTIQSVEARESSQLEAAFTAMTDARAGGLFVLADPFTIGQRKRIVDLAARHKLPDVYFWKEFVEAGGLVSYGPSFVEMFRRAAVYVDRILKGANPAGLPVEQPIKFELAINLKTAKALGLTIPQSILVRADHIMQ